MAAERFEATYLIETPLDPLSVAEVMAGEQSCGTFTRVPGETEKNVLTKSRRRCCLCSFQG